MTTTWILILMMTVGGKSTIESRGIEYPTKNACFDAGREFVNVVHEGSWSDVDWLSYRCIPGSSEKSVDKKDGK